MHHLRIASPLNLFNRFQFNSGYATISQASSWDTVGLLRKVLLIRNVSRVNSSGKVRSVSAVVVVGDQKGSAGVGMARGPDTQSAVRKAADKAKSKMKVFPRLDNRTIFSNIDYKFHCVRLELRTAKPGHGLVCNKYIHEICRCIGISDLTAKVRGSKNPLNVINGTFAALEQQKTPQQLARNRGKKVFDIESTFYGKSA